MGTGTIAMKFILYGAIAAVGGGVVGTAIGATLIPWVIFTSYGIMYTLPSLHLELYWPLSLGAIGAGFGLHGGRDPMGDVGHGPGDPCGTDAAQGAQGRQTNPAGAYPVYLEALPVLRQGVLPESVPV